MTNHKERTPLPRTWMRLAHLWRRTRRRFHGGCFGVYGTPPGKPFRDVLFGAQRPLFPKPWLRKSIYRGDGHG